MLLYICRHGQTDHNLKGIIQGHLDTPLNDHGRFEASRLSKRLSTVKFDEAYTSPLSRAKETAEIVMQHHPDVQLVSDELLKERGLGSMEGRRWARGESAPADAESHVALAKRISKWLIGLLSSHKQAAQTGNEPTILVVSHGAWISSFRNVLSSNIVPCSVGPEVDTHAHLLNTSVMKVKLDLQDDEWVAEILSIGDLSHLNDVDEPDLEVVDDVKD